LPSRIFVIGGVIPLASWVIKWVIKIPMHSEITTDGREALTQFLPVEPIAPFAKGAEPLKTVGLADNRAGTHHLPTLAPSIARCIDLIEPTRGWGQVFGLRQGALTGCLTRAINIEDLPLSAGEGPSVRLSAALW
jgi:hypothetical protein